jgi:hypothetical protein
MDKQNYKMWGVLAGAAYCLYYFATINDWHFIDNVNLVIHEAGHVLFFIFGQYLYVAGGSILPILMPALFAFYFYRNDQKSSAAFLLLWVAINFFSVAHYASDARVMQLPLLGGDNSGHDWNFLLSRTGLLRQTKIISDCVYFLGFVSIIFSLRLAFKNRKIDSIQDRSVQPGK